MVENSLHESFPEPPITAAATSKALDRQSEPIAYGYEPTFTPRTSQTLENTNDWSLLSDDVVKILDKIGGKGCVKMEEIVA